MSEANVCTPNIGPLERRRRLTFGLQALAIGLVIGVTIAWFDLPRMLRLAAFLPLWMGAIGVMQAREKTCVALVQRGERNMDAGPERVTDESTLRQLKTQARKVHVKSLVLAALISAALLAIP